jgi:hypothetical protein
MNGNATVGTLHSVIGSLNTVEYDAPLQVPAANPVIVKAVPNADTSIAATASVTIKLAAILVQVSPPKPQVQIGTTQQFIAEVQNAEDQSVTWQLHQLHEWPLHRSRHSSSCGLHSLPR